MLNGLLFLKLFKLFLERKIVKRNANLCLYVIVFLSLLNRI